MTVSAISTAATHAAHDIGAVLRENNPRYEALAERFTAQTATAEQRAVAYDLIAGLEANGTLTDEALAQQGAQAIADNRTVPVDIAEVGPLVPLGTALGPFESNDAAAIAMMDYSNPLSIEINLENGGLVFSNEAGEFFITTPMPGTLAGFDPSQVPQPEGMTLEACYHGHADYSKADGTRTDIDGDEFNSDHFSQQDKRVADGGYWGPVIYVSTPSGDFRKYDSATRQDTVIQEGTRGREDQERPGVMPPPGIMIPV